MSEHVHRDQEHDSQNRLGLRPKYKQISSSCAALRHFFQDSRGSGQAPWRLWIACCVQRLRLALLSHMVTGRASFFTAMAWMQCQQGGASKAGALCVFQCPPQEKTEKAWLGLIPSCPILTFKTKAAWKWNDCVRTPCDHTCTLPRSTRGNHSFWFVAFVKHVYTHGKSQRTTILSFLGSHEWLVLGSFLTCPCLRWALPWKSAVAGLFWTRFANPFRFICGMLSESCQDECQLDPSKTVCLSTPMQKWNTEIKTVQRWSTPGHATLIFSRVQVVQVNIEGAKALCRRPLHRFADDLPVFVHAVVLPRF